jgi:pyridinium-3,5-biscarboxylic acid mononucleotide sulfurtransferase
MKPNEDVSAENLQAARSALRAVLRGYDSLMVAYSGGVDSAYLAWEAHEVLGSRMLAVIADSPSLPRKELAAAVAFAEAHTIPLRILETHEMERADYVRNDSQRCFHCKDELFIAMEQLRAELGFATIAYGRNTDDSGDFRPGQQAAQLHHAVAPLAEAGLGKQAIRALAQAANLNVWDKPASACLSSRLEYGRPVTREALLQIEQAEAALHELGYRHLRVRHHGDLARVELDRATLAQGLTLTMLNEINTATKAAGFTYVTVDAEGYRSGSMNQVLPIEVLLQSGTPHAS